MHFSKEFAMDGKQQAFVFFCKQLYDWYSVDHNPERNDLSVLKVLKLLFFVSAYKRKDGEDLLDIFDKFQAMPYGPVELDIYTELSSINSQNSIRLTREFMRVAESIDFREFNQIYLNKVQLSIFEFKEKFPEMISFDAFRLVNISHQWNSWTKSYNMACLKGLSIWPMEVVSIRKDNQYFG